MTDMFKGKLPEYHHLKKIRDRLWENNGNSKVSVMIGSGFSLNASKLDDSLDDMLTWMGLKRKILDELDLFDKPESKSVLEIADIYVSEYGRDSLDNLIKEAVPDQNYEPGEIHKSLLQLPWSDVYTTNYDTLLERTLPHIIERNYNIIYDARDIPNSISPRIVKLHGSFPSNRPFIFTKSDYESYYDQFAPLVNMVQQSIMETTFVLIGFSGDDPNFETWTEWVHNNLGEHMPKIYMIAYDEPDIGNRLKEKGITVIDFKEVYTDKKDTPVYEQLFEDVFHYLSYKEKRDKEDWPYKGYNVKEDAQFDDLLDAFIYNRKSYPGWIFAPDVIKKGNIQQIHLACNELQSFLMNKKLDLRRRIAAIHEIIWAYDTFQIPFNYKLHKTIVEIVSEGLEEDELPNKLLNVIIRLVKEVRLDYDEVEFIKYIKILNKYELDKDSKNQLFNEKILMRMAKFEYGEALAELDNWMLTKKDFEWMVKKAVLLKRIGEIEKAKEIFENTLSTIRRILVIKRNNYRLLSIEGVILSNLIALNKETVQNSKERLSVLEKTLCNPLKELEFLFSRVKQHEFKGGLVEKKGFDPDQITQTSSFRSFLDLELVDSYSILMFYEEFGLGPTNQLIAKNAINIALKNMEVLYSFYTWVLYAEIGSIKEIDYFFSRQVIYDLDEVPLSKFVEIVLSGIISEKNIILMLEILSRIYFALKENQKIKVDIFVINLFTEKEFHIKYPWEAPKVLKNLFKRILFVKDNSGMGDFLSEVYKLPIIGDPDGGLSVVNVRELSFFDPSFEFTFHSNIKISINSAEVFRLLDILKGEKSVIRDAALKRLTYLLETKNLTIPQENKLRTQLVNIVRSEITNISNFLLDSYLILLSKDHELQERYRQIRIKDTIPKSYDKETGITTMGNGLNILLGDLRNIFPNQKNRENFILTLNDEMYNCWMENLYEWWDSQKEWLLREQKGSFFGESQDLMQMVVFLKNSFLPYIPDSCLNTFHKNKLESIYVELCESKFSMALLLIPSLLKVNIVGQNSIDKIDSALKSNNIEVFESAVTTIYDLSYFKNLNELDADLSSLKNTVINLFIYRKEITFLYVTKSLSSIIKDFPEFFTKNDYKNIVSSLNLTLDDIKDNCFKNSLKTIQENELLAALAKLAGLISSNVENIDKKMLEKWRLFVMEDRLPEVRRYEYLFK